MSDKELSYRELFFLWVPLALSWAMMSIAGPVVSAGIARLPNPSVNLAAHGLTMDIAVLVESPIIMILSTSVALVRNRQTYLLLQRFVARLTVILTIVGFVVYFTSLYDVLFLRVIGVPADVAAAARPALRAMLLWPAAIGWRRLWQGILIVHGQSKLVSYGTVFRLVSLAATVAVGVRLGLTPGALVGGLAMGISVIVEMAAIAWWTLPILRAKVLPVMAAPSEDTGTMTLPDLARGAKGEDGRLLRFYWPLAGTNVMRVLARPMTAAAIARAVDSTVSLAAWPVASGLSSLLTSSAMALPEVVLARIHDQESQRRLAGFSLRIGLALTIILAVLVATPLARLYFDSLLGVPTEIEPLALAASVVLVPMPLLIAIRDFLRGVLIWQRQSGAVQLGMFVNLATLTVILLMALGLTRTSGIMLASLATVGAELVEVAALLWLVRRVPDQAPTASFIN